MIHLVLNSLSAGSKSKNVWKNISKDISFNNFCDLRDFPQKANRLNFEDTILAAGGDGTLHSLVNQVIGAWGVENLPKFKFGYIGLGSNNSFLQPIQDKKKIKNVPLQIEGTPIYRDLLRIEIDGDSESPKVKYLVSNGSFGFLAKANQIFNSDPQIRILKRISVTLADVISFLKCLYVYRPITVKLSSNGQVFESRITNLHIVKSPYFTKDLYLKNTSGLDSGLIDVALLVGLSRIQILRRFFEALALGKMEKAVESHWTCDSLTVESEHLLQMEIDGEIYLGRNFRIQCLRKHLRVCQ